MSVDVKRCTRRKEENERRKHEDKKNIGVRELKEERNT
jgi:hypothetical protein